MSDLDMIHTQFSRRGSMLVDGIVVYSYAACGHIFAWLKAPSSLRGKLSVQVETGKVDILEDSKQFLNDMMHTLPAFLENPDRHQAQKAGRPRR
jgi:hypothetical protein